MQFSKNDYMLLELEFLSVTLLSALAFIIIPFCKWFCDASKDWVKAVVASSVDQSSYQKLSGCRKVLHLRSCERFFYKTIHSITVNLVEVRKAHHFRTTIINSWFGRLFLDCVCSSRISCQKVQSPNGQYAILVEEYQKDRNTSFWRRNCSLSYRLTL